MLRTQCHNGVKIINNIESGRNLINYIATITIRNNHLRICEWVTRAM